MAINKRTGFTVQDILNMDEFALTHLDEKQLRPIVRQLADAANKRIKAMEKSGEKSPAYRGVMKSGGKFSTGGKDYSALQKEVSRELRFLKHKTSTLSGWKKVKEETAEKIEQFGFSLEKEEWSDFWDAYDKLSELDPDVKLESIKYDVFKEIHSRMDDKSKSPEDIATGMKKEVKRLYEERKRTEEQRKSGGVSKYFKRR